jgi:hypothetical protein
MSDSGFIPTADHTARIRNLERLADLQREQFHVEMAELSAALRPFEVARSLTMRLVDGASLANRFLGRGRLGFGLGGLLANLGLGAATVEAVESRKFPWKSTLLAGASIVQVGRWLKHRHDHE